MVKRKANPLIKEVYKKFRVDINYWESEYRFLFLKWYKYDVWSMGKTRTFYRLIKLGARKNKVKWTQ